jgi:hypothetical protein
MITPDKVKQYMNAGHDNYEVARWLLNLEISKHTPLSIDDLPDTMTVASEIEAIVECLDTEEYEDAINIAIDGAQLILEDEGFELNNDGEEMY